MKKDEGIQKRENYVSRYESFRDEEMPLLAKLPATPMNWRNGKKPPFSSILTFNIIPTAPSNYRSMREIYGLDPALSE